MARKVLIFSTNYFPYIGGAEVAIKEITDRVDSSTASFSMITPRYSRANKRFERIGNVDVYRVGIGCFLDKWIIPCFGYRKALAIHSSHEYDAIWCMMASQASIAGARFKNKFPNISLVLTLQEGDEESHLKRYVFGSDFLFNIIIKPIYLKVFKVADHITAISNYLILRANKNTKSTPTTLIPNGVSVDKFDVPKDIELRKALGIDDNECVVITTSRLVQKNGIADLVEAVKFLPENVKLVIVGDGSERAKLELRSKSLELRDRVVFVGNIKQDEIPKYLSIADIFCRPSLSEGQGISFLEAMASGVPVVATPVGGIPDFLKDGETGLFCKKQDPKDIARSIAILLNDSSLYSVIKDNARKLVREEYSWVDISKKMIDAILV